MLPLRPLALLAGFSLVTFPALADDIGLIDCHDHSEATQVLAKAAKTPKLKPGDHTIAIQKVGYAVWQRTLTVAPGATLTVNAALEKQQ